VQVGVTWWFAVCILKDDEPYQDFPTEQLASNEPHCDSN
jgi:hypothetical protein